MYSKPELRGQQEQRTPFRSIRQSLKEREHHSRDLGHSHAAVPSASTRHMRRAGTVGCPVAGLTVFGTSARCAAANITAHRQLGEPFEASHSPSYHTLPTPSIDPHWSTVLHCQHCTESRRLHIQVQWGYIPLHSSSRPPNQSIGPLAILAR